MEVEQELAALRKKLNNRSKKIVARLQERSEYPLNESRYQKDPLNPVYIRDPDSPHKKTLVSPMEFSIFLMESYHNALGRYKYPDQQPLINKRKTLPESKMKRVVRDRSLTDIEIDIKGQVIDHYTTSLKEICAPGEDDSVYGETVFCDADTVLLLNERINFGRQVAAIKLNSQPDLGSILGDRESLKKKLTYEKREREVVDEFRSLARRYGLDENFAEGYAAWIIQTTMKVELDYLQGLYQKHGANAALKIYKRGKASQEAVVETKTPDIGKP